MLIQAFIYALCQAGVRPNISKLLDFGLSRKMMELGTAQAAVRLTLELICLVPLMTLPGPFSTSSLMCANNVPKPLPEGWLLRLCWGLCLILGIAIPCRIGRSLLMAKPAEGRLGLAGARSAV